MSCRIRAVEHRKCAAGLPGLQDRILLNYTRIENAHKVRKKTFDFLLFIEVQQTFSFPFFLLRHNKCLNASMQLMFLSSCNSSIMLKKLAGLMQPMRSAFDQP